MKSGIKIRTVNVTRYVTPLREGGSLPAIAEADDGFLYVVKFRGSGQGIKVLIAELLAGEIARVLELKIPEIVYAQLDEAFGRTEGDEEIQDLLKASTGLNLALHYLSGASTFDSLATKPASLPASKIVWLDAYVMNMDRTVRNTNILLWHKELWLIDNGAAFYFHHAENEFENQAERPFQLIKNHVLLSFATEISAADKICRAILTDSILEDIVNLIPENWLTIGNPDIPAGQQRKAYLQYLVLRRNHSDIFVNEIEHAGKASI